MPAHQVKCYLIENIEKKSVKDGVLEIKRFNISSQHESLLYENLVTNVKSYFNEHFKTDDCEVKTFWLDDEGELIRFSTSVEFMDVIKSSKENLLRIYVQKKRNIESASEQNPSIALGEIFSLLNNPQLISNNFGDIFGSVFGKVDEQQSNCCGENKFEPSAKEIEERVKAGIQNLKNMGFSNDNDCLSKLLRDCKGNINPVLDILKAQWL